MPPIMHNRLTHQEAAEARSIAEAVARQVRDAVADEISRPGAGDITGIASSGDTTFSMDNAAEAALDAAIAGLGTPVACYSEDQGLQVPDGGAKWLLVVDPIDGTRPAAAGLEACVVSVAVARLTDEPAFADVAAGAVCELRRDRLYSAARGQGAWLDAGSDRRPLSPKDPGDLRNARWTLETVGRPALLNYIAAGPLIDETSLRGGQFALNSSAFGICQVAAGALAGMVDLSARLLRDIDTDARYVRSVCHGRIMGLWAYDIAAAALIAMEAGCAVTDAWGRSLDTLSLVHTEAEDMASCICAASADQHAKMLALLNKGFANCERLWKSGALTPDGLE